MSHAFFVAMGGFHFYNEDGPTHPLSPAHVLQLVKRGHLVPPTAAEILSQSKGEGLSMTIAIVQTLWFVAQFIARLLQGILVTNLEVMTVAYTVMTLAMYAAWWKKPLNVSCAIRVPEEEVKEAAALPRPSIGGRATAYIIGRQGVNANLLNSARVPIFGVGDGQGVYLQADVIAPLVATVFGAVHCIAWSYTFHSHIEQQLWRCCAVVITIFPLDLATNYQAISRLHDRKVLFAVEAVIGAIYTPLTVIYIVARVILIVITFTSLTRLPFGVYQSVQWAAFIPHF